MNHQGGPHMPPGGSPHQSRRPHEYQYQVPQHLPYLPHVPPQFYGPVTNHHYPPPQWYPSPYQHYPPHMPRQYHQHAPLVVSSYPQVTTGAPMPRQNFQTPQPPPARTPHPEHPTPTPSAATSEMPMSLSTTPTTAAMTTSTPPLTKSVSPPVQTPLLPLVRREGFQPQVSDDKSTHWMPNPNTFQLPWYSIPASSFPSPRPRRRKRIVQLTSNKLELPARQNPTRKSQSDHEPHMLPDSGEPASLAGITASRLSPAPPMDMTPSLTTGLEGANRHPDVQESIWTPEVAIAQPAILAASQPAILAASQPASSSEVPTGAPVTPTHKRKPTVPIVPIIPITILKSFNSVTSPRPKESGKHDGFEQLPPVIPAQEVVPVVHMTDSDDAAVAVDATPPPVTEKAPLKSWAELLRGKTVPQSAGQIVLATSTPTNGFSASKPVTVADALKSYTVDNDTPVSFLEPRGLVNTGNMCYMNSILQMLIFCVPFYEFLDQTARRAVHSFKSDTPLIDAMIMFMREYPVLETASSVDKLRSHLKSDRFEKYGEAFIPEYVYDVIKRLPRFSSMRRGHQQDAEEFLGFLLEGLHDECVYVMRRSEDTSSVATTISSQENGVDQAVAAGDKGWLEVGPKQRAAVTRDSGSISLESPITKIFGGKLRSEFRVPGLKNSVTLEPYQPLQLDIGSPQVYNITDALKGLTRSEAIQGDFNSPRGPGQVATKQVFIETLPPVLILHLKRFQYDNAGGTQKIWRKIGYPLELEIPKEIFGPHKRAAYAINGLPKYRLIGVVYHHGKNASGGHYTVDVRRQEGREWIRMDDTFIRRVGSDDVAGEGGEEDPRALVAALENHKRDESNDILKATGFEALEDENDEDDQGGWSQVNGVNSPPGKKWSGVVNGAGTVTPGTAGKTTPKNNKSSVKDNKIAYILFYQKI